MEINHSRLCSWPQSINSHDPPPRHIPASRIPRRGGHNAILEVNMKFQERCDRWLVACFGEKIARDKIERNHRFLEESLELVQSCGCSREEAMQLVDYVFSRPVGDTKQEVGGVMNTLAALCISRDIDMMEAGHIEIDRCWTKVDKIRAKQAAKPDFSPLPGVAE